MIKKVLIAWAAVGLFVGMAHADEGHKHGHKEAGKTGAQTIQGEILDMACYMGHEAKGPKHKSCAVKCVKGGAPMGLLTPEGKVLLVVENHNLAASSKAYEQLKDWAGTQVKINGEVTEKGGIEAILVTSAEKLK